MRRLLLPAVVALSMATILSVAACRQKSGKSAVREITWTFPVGGFGPSSVVVTVPRDASSKNRMPVLIALHGQGESRKPPAKGARGWVDDYEMLKAFRRLTAPPLRRDDFGGMVTDERLRRHNTSLKTRPYRGVIVVSPYLPDEFRAKNLNEDAHRYGDFLVKKVLPKVYRATPAIDTWAATGIDGVSLGGRAAVTVGLGHPDVFGAVGGIQAAFGPKQVPIVTSMVTQARKKNPSLRFRIMSSREDRFKDVTLQISAALEKAGLPHQVDIVEGDHSYEFNRGPGVYEMLIYYDRILRKEPFLEN